MEKGGNAVISGQVFARDFSEGNKMEVMNIQAKQVAARGTQVVLIPYNDYFKEWIKVNEAQRKKAGKALPFQMMQPSASKVSAFMMMPDTLNL